MRECFRSELHLSATNKQKLEQVNAIIERYAAQGYRLTLRQLYYQLVSQALIPNKVQEYAKLSKLLVNGRMAGHVDWDSIEDRIRVPKIPYWVTGITGAINDTIYQYRLDRMEGQDNYIEVHCEKDALSNILYRVTSEYHIKLMINRGYSSCTAMHDAYERFSRGISQGKSAHVLYCVPKGTLILDANGYTPIEQIVNGSKIISNNELTTILHKHKRRHSGKMVQIRASSMLPIHTTPTHPILISRIERESHPDDLKSYRSFHQSTWKEAINVKEGDYLSVLKPTFPEKRDIILNPTIIKSNSRTPKQVKTGFTLNEHVARLFGCYIGDGSYSGAPTITFNSSDRNIELYRSIITDELGYETNTRDEKDRNVTQLKFGGTVIGRFLTDCFGSYATSKKIPRFIFNSPTNIVTEFIRGYIDADGYTQNTDNNNIKKRISTASQGLALQLQLLILTKFGELPAVFKDEREGWIEICGVKTYQHDKYEVHIYSQTVSKIFGNIYKSKIGRRKWFEHNNRIYVPVTKVDHYPFDGEVYNLTTEDSMLPINNIITHNCGDHDPSGLDMVRDIRDRLEEFGLDEIEVRHIAITREQIDEYNPPPNPAKVTDPRAKEYIALHGNTSWEVDALNPETLHELLVNEIEGLVNRDKYEAVLEQEEEDKEKLREFADRYNEEE